MSRTAHPPREKLERFAQDDLQDPDLSVVARHVKECDTCRNILAILRPGEVEAEPGEAAPETAGPATVNYVPTQRTLGDYELIEVLSEGGMGVVYLARDKNNGRQCVVKTIRSKYVNAPGFASRFQREASILANLDSDYIVTLYGSGSEPEHFMAMALLKGETLERKLQREGKLPVDEIIRLAGQLVRGLMAAHEQSLIHRDLKPANLFLETRAEDPGRPRVKILDFGLARPIEDTSGFPDAGHIVGTPGYMAPEQFTEPDHLDPRTDLFSVGCILYRMATGKLPFPETYDPRSKARFPTDSWRKSLLDSGTLPKPPEDLNAELPHGLSDLTLRLLLKRREDRPATAWELMAELGAIASELSQGKALSSGQQTPIATVGASPAGALTPTTQETAARPAKAMVLSAKTGSLGCVISITLTACLGCLLVPLTASVFIGSGERAALVNAQKELESLKTKIKEDQDKAERRMKQEKLDYEVRMAELKKMQVLIASIGNPKQRTEAEEKLQRDRDEWERRIKESELARERELAKIQADSATAEAAARAAASRPAYYQPAYWYRGYWYPY